MLFSTLFILLAVILLTLIGAWCVRPAFRRWAETPKYRMLRQEDRFAARRTQVTSGSGDDIDVTSGERLE